MLGGKIKEQRKSAEHEKQLLATHCDFWAVIFNLGKMNGFQSSKCPGCSSHQLQQPLWKEVANSFLHPHQVIPEYSQS